MEKARSALKKALPGVWLTGVYINGIYIAKLNDHIKENEQDYDPYHVNIKRYAWRGAEHLPSILQATSRRAGGVCIFWIIKENKGGE